VTTDTRLPPRVVAFDVNETLFSLDRLGAAFGAAGLDPAAVPLWFARVLRDGFALAAMGRYEPFPALAAENLRALAPGIAEPTVKAVLGAFRELDPHPDVEPALQILRDAAIPAVTLTNGSAEVVQAMLAGAGLSGYFARAFSVDDVGRWKPAPDPYRLVADAYSVEPRQVALVACHPWDCAGASMAGLVAAWVNRTDQRWPAVFPPPDVTGPDLTAVVGSLLG
jgi:2-haloacid dehalogenase